MTQGAGSQARGTMSRLRTVPRRWPMGVLGVLLAGRGAAQVQPPSPESLPAEPPVGGFFWTWIVPVLLFVVSVAATAALYRHFSKDASGASRDGTTT